MRNMHCIVSADSLCETYLCWVPVPSGGLWLCLYRVIGAYHMFQSVFGHDSWHCARAVVSYLEVHHNTVHRRCPGEVNE